MAQSNKRKKLPAAASASEYDSDDVEDPTKETLLKTIPTSYKGEEGSKCANNCNSVNKACRDTKADPFFTYKFVKQIVLVLLWVAMGYGRGLAGPTLPDLKEQLGADYETISRVAAMSSVGFVGGCFTGGILHERFHKHTDVFMAFSVIIGGMASAAIPWMPTLWSLVPLFIIAGFAGAVQNAGGNTMVLDLWGEKSASAMFTLHLGFGIGAFIGPIISEPFLSAKIGEVVVGINESQLNMTGNITNATITKDIMRPAHLAFPFALEGMMDIVFAIIFMIYYLKGPPKGMPVKEGTSKIKDLFNPAQCTAGNSVYGFLILSLLFIFYIQAIGGELVFGQFLYAFATESAVKFTTAEAANLTAVFYLCHLSGRGIGAILSKWLSINIILTLDIFGLIGSTVFLAILGSTNHWALWVGTGLIGLLCSFVYPAGMIWANLHMKVNSMVVMVTMFGGAVGFVVYTYLGGYLIEYVSMNAFLYLEVAYAVILAVVYLLMFLLGRKYGKHGETDDDDDDDDNDIVEYTDGEARIGKTQK